MAEDPASHVDRIPTAVTGETTEAAADGSTGAAWKDDSLGFLVNRLARLFTRALRDEIAPFGVGPGQFAQLIALYEQDGLSQQELCEIVDIEQPTMANTLRRMERDGLVTRTPDPSDRRRARVELTQLAREHRPGLIAAAERVNERSQRGIGQADLAITVRTLARLADSLRDDE